MGEDKDRTIDTLKGDYCDMQQRHRNLETIYKKLSADADRLADENKQLKVECKHANNAVINLESEKLHASAECSQLLEGRYTHRKLHTYMYVCMNVCISLHTCIRIYIFTYIIHSYINK